MNFQAIKQIREKLELTQEEFATLLGTTKTSVARYSQENGQKPQGDVLKKLILLHLLSQETSEVEKMKNIIKTSSITGLLLIISIGISEFVENPKLVSLLNDSIDEDTLYKDTVRNVTGLSPLGGFWPLLGPVGAVACGVIGVAVMAGRMTGSSKLASKDSESFVESKQTLSLTVDDILSSPQSIMLYNLIKEKIESNKI